MSLPSLVFLPGLMCDRAVWDHQISDLADVADSVCMDWGPQDTSLVEMAQETLDAAPGSFALAGHSMGGRVAFEVYRRAPHRITHFAVLNTGVTPLAAGPPGQEEERGRRRLLRMAREQGVRAMAREWLKGMIPAHRQGDRELTEAVIRMFERKNADIFEIQMLALLGRPDARPVLPTIRCPALVLTGEDDVWSTPARHREMVEQMGPAAELALIPQSGHMSTMEQPEAVAAALRNWLARK